MQINLKYTILPKILFLMLLIPGYISAQYQTSWVKYVYGEPAKIYTLGESLWINPSEKRDSVRGVFVTDAFCDKDGNLVIGGYFKNFAMLAPDSVLLTLSDDLYFHGFIAKFDTAGKLLWSVQQYGNANQYLRGLSPDGNGNILITGVANGLVVFDTSNSDVKLDMGPVRSAFIAKYDGGGNFLWAKALNSVNDPCSGKFSDRFRVQVIDRIQLTPRENILAQGYFRGRFDFDPSSKATILESRTSAGYENFMAMYDSAFRLVWIHHYRQPNQSVRPVSFLARPDGSVIILGTLYGNADIDPGEDICRIQGKWQGSYLATFDTAGRLQNHKYFRVKRTLEDVLKYRLEFSCRMDQLIPSGNEDFLACGRYSGRVSFSDVQYDHIPFEKAVFIAKFSGDFRLIWKFNIMDPYVRINNVYPLHQDALLVMGTYKVMKGQDTVNEGFGADESLLYERDLFLAIYDSTGKISWKTNSSVIGRGLPFSSPVKLVPDNDGNHFYIGNYSGKLKIGYDQLFAPDKEAPHTMGVMIVKLKAI